MSAREAVADILRTVDREYDDLLERADEVIAAHLKWLEDNEMLRKEGTVELCQNHVYKECRNHGGRWEFEECKVKPCPLKAAKD